MPEQIEFLIDLRRRIEDLESQEKTFYLKGTWTPTFNGSGGAGAYTYTVQVGHYTRLGNTVFIRGLVAISAIGGAPVGDMRIAGLPFTSANTTNLYGLVDISSSNFNYAAGAIDLKGLIAPNTALIQLVESFDNAIAVNAPAANFTNANVALTFAGQYQV